MNKIFALILCAAFCVPSTLLATQDRWTFYGQGGCESEYSRSSDSMLVDIVFIRPFGIVGTAIGSVAYVASLPFTLLGGNAGEAGKKLVVEPAAYTFKRPLGSSTRCK